MYSKAMDNTIKDFIENKARIGTITIIDGECVVGKILDRLYLTVKTNINIYEVGFSNGDVCKVLGETNEGKLVIKRIEDGKEGIVHKNQVNSAEWVVYKF